MERRQGIDRKVRLLIYILTIFLFACSGNLKKAENPIAEKSSDSTFKEAKNEIISDSGGIIEKGSQKLELEFIGWRCLCPNWITTSDRLKYQGKGLESDPAKYCFYIEPADSSLVLPGSFYMLTHDVIVTGKFITDSGFPKNYEASKEDARPAKVFRYTYFKIIAKKNAPY